MFTGFASEQGHKYNSRPTFGAGIHSIENPFGALQRTAAHGLPSS